MAMDWVTNAQTYGGSRNLDESDVVWLPLTYNQAPTPVESGNVQPWAHFEESPMYAKAVRGQIHIAMRDNYSDVQTETMLLTFRITKTNMDPLTQEPFLPQTAFYTLDNPVDANDEFLWQKQIIAYNGSGWFSTARRTDGPTWTIDVDWRGTRKLEPLEQLWLVQDYSQFAGIGEIDGIGRITTVPYLRTLLSERA